jgi:hypothetical protein
MAVTVGSFLAANTHFDARYTAKVQAAIDEASRHFDAGVCGNLYDDLVAAQTAVILLSDPNGLPTSATGDKSGFLEQAQERLKSLKRLVPVRGLGTTTEADVWLYR